MTSKNNNPAADKDILLDLVRGRVSDNIIRKVSSTTNLSLPEQEELFAALMSHSHEKEQQQYADGVYNPRKGNRYSKWFREYFRKGRDYAEQSGLIKAPIDRVHREVEKHYSEITAVTVPTRSLLYHATSYSSLERIKRLGLTPRDPQLETGLRTDKAVFFFESFDEAYEFTRGLFEGGVWRKGVILKINGNGLPLYKRSTGSATGAGEELYTNKRVHPSQIIGITVITKKSPS